jgi:Methylmalonyl Co-A mutase-associated GTPase MeaB
MSSPFAKQVEKTLCDLCICVCMSLFALSCTRQQEQFLPLLSSRSAFDDLSIHNSSLIFQYTTHAAGYNVVIVESVGLGQSEVEIDNAVDMLVMIVPPGGGDGLQARSNLLSNLKSVYFIFGVFYFYIWHSVRLLNCSYHYHPFPVPVPVCRRPRKV